MGSNIGTPYIPLPVGTARSYHHEGRDLIANISKGRYSKSKVETIVNKLCIDAAHDMERKVTEFLLLQFVQILHYELGLEGGAIGSLYRRLVGQMTAFDAGTYSIDDMRQALKDDADFELEIKWVEGGGCRV